MPSNPILILARGSDLRDKLQNALQAAGHPTSSVATPADAVAYMRDHPVDLIVAEGLAASGAIASLRVGSGGAVTPVLAVAPAGDVEARIAFLEAGADDVLAADFVGSTSGMIAALEQAQPERAVLITECSMADNIAGAFPGTDFLRPCNLCPHMQRITLAGVRASLEHLAPAIEVPEEIAAGARRAVQRMLDASRPRGT